MADKRISQLVERINIANNDVLPIVASGATTTNKVTISTIQDWMQDNLDVGVTSVGITLGTTGTNINVTGSPVTSSGNITINIPTASATNRGALSSTDWSTFNNKLSSVGLTMPSAFTVSNSPLTANGTISVAGAGTVSQYIRGDGSLADFPQGGGGGGASVSYYLNGSVSQGTIGGIAYREMNKTPILGTGTDFVAIADGYLASFITDAGDPGLLEIPGGNWNFETYFSASSGGGSPTFYIELYKVNSGGTATLIASNSGTPELIAFGTTITPYFSTLAVPTTSLTITDRLALRYYVARSGRTITMHTENSHLCQIITTFTTGLTALNGLTAQVQNFATGSSGTDFGISSSTSTHTFNLPTASATNRGALSSADWTTFNGKQAALNGTGFVKISGTTISYDNSTYLTTGTAASTYVPYSGATSNVDLGSYILSANNLTANGGLNAGRLELKHASNASLIKTGYFVLSPSSNNTTVHFGFSTGASTWKNFGFSSHLLTDNTITIFSLPSAGGTLAVTSDLGAYLPLSGGTLTGALNGTSASFNTGTSVTPNFIVFGGGQSVGGGKGNIRSSDSGGGNYWDFGRDNLTTGDFVLSNLGSSPYFRVATLTGAATFSSSVNTSGDVIITKSTNPSLILNNSTTTNSFRLMSTDDGTFKIQQTGIANLLSITLSGAATFSSSVTAGGFVSSVSTNGFNLDLSKSAGFGALIQLKNTSSSSNELIRVLDSSNNIISQIFPASNGIAITTGNVGIGTASPSQLIEASKSVNSDTVIQVTNVNTGGSATAQFFASNGTTATQFYHAGTGYGGLGVIVANQGGLYNETSAGLAMVSNNAGGVIRFATGGTTERMRINAGGNVGIGTNNPTRRLQVTAAASEYVFVSDNTRNTSGDLNTLLTLGNNANNTSSYFIVCSVSAGDRMYVYGNGNIVNANGSYGSLSDVKLKENIIDATPKLDDLLKVKIRNYNLIGSEIKQIGVIAQELEEVFPAMIDESEDFEEVEVPQLDEEGNEVLNEEGEVVTTKERISKGTTTKSVKYSVFVPMLIKAIQEQQEIINEMRSEIDSLKTK